MRALLASGSEALHALERRDDHGEADAEHVVARLGAQVGAELGGDEHRDQRAHEDDERLHRDEALREATRRTRARGTYAEV